MSLSDWIRAKLGESAALSVLHEQNAALRRQVAATQMERDKAREVIGWLLEPQTAECVKTRFETRIGAEDLARRLERMDGDPMMVYRCRTCPRHPHTTAKYWHVAHAQSPRNRVPARKADQGLTHRIQWRAAT